MLIYPAEGLRLRMGGLSERTAESLCERRDGFRRGS